MSDDTPTTPEEYAQGLSYREGLKGVHSAEPFGSDAFETWLRKAVKEDARTRGVDLTPDLVSLCWAAYSGGVYVRSERAQETSLSLTVQQEACRRYLEEHAGTVVFVLESLPEPWTVYGVEVDNKIIATMRPGDEGGVDWYPGDSAEPEFLTYEQMRERLYKLGDRVVHIDFEGKKNEVPRSKVADAPTTRAGMWEHEIDPANIPTTPWRNYRLYASDGTPLAGYYSLDRGEFQHDNAGPRGETFGADEIREEIAANAADFGPVTLRALTAPETSPADAS